jgi:hypothetical protein
MLPYFKKVCIPRETLRVVELPQLTSYAGNAGRNLHSARRYIRRCSEHLVGCLGPGHIWAGAVLLPQLFLSRKR